MARQFVLGHTDKGVQVKIGHEHCAVCGACRLDKDQRHRCPEPVDEEVLAVMFMEQRRIISRSTRIPDNDL